MRNGRSGDGVTRSALPEVPGRRPLWAAEAYGPSAECSITALLENSPMTEAEKRHLEECEFCSGMLRRLAESSAAPFGAGSES
jgi:hypothetical protein